MAVERNLTDAIVNAVNILEEKIDEELQKYDPDDEAFLMKLREKRLREISEADKRKKELAKLGHGKYEEIEEKEFFKVRKESPNVVVHFFRNDFPKYKVYDSHFPILASKHFETRFVKLNAEKAPFLVERLKITVFPTLLIIVGGEISDKMPEFKAFKGNISFKAEELERRLGITGVIKYDDPSTNPENIALFKRPDMRRKCNIRSSSSTSSLSDLSD